MEVRLLGPLRVDGADGHPVAIGGQRQRLLLALLALRPGLAMRTDRLIDELWGDNLPNQPASALQLVVFKLRRALGAETIATIHPGYSLQVDPDEVDAHRFERLVGEGRAALTAGRPDLAADCFDQAMALWRDDALAEFDDIRTVANAATRWQELRATASEDRFEARLALGQHHQLVAELHDAITAHPYRERLRAQVMVALYRSGRQAEALRAYGDARRVLGDDLGVQPGVALRHLERQILDHDRALDLPAAATMAAVVAPGRSAGTAVRAELGALVGRQNEIDALEADLRLLSEGGGGLTLIGGEPGIGKTRLIEAIVAAATTRAVTVAWGRCYPGRGAPAFWPWIQILRQLLEEVEPDAVRAAAGPRGGELAQLVPEFGGILDDAEPPPPADPDTARFRLADALTSFLRAVSRRRPMLVALDDLHWGDPGSLAVLELAAGELTDVPVRFVATYRTADPTTTGRFAGCLADLSRVRSMRRVELAGLDDRAIAALLADAGIEMADESVATLRRRTLGNPFFVTEIVKLLTDPDTPHDGSVEVAVPASVRDVVRQRIDRLPTDTVSLLAAAAILSQEVDPALLAAMTDHSAGAVLERLEPAVDAAILVRLIGARGRYQFVHGIVAETIDHDLAAATRARLHERAAQTLQGHHRDLPGPHLIPIADHFLRALPVAAIDDVIDAALRASRWAAEHVAHRQAEDQLRAALDLLGNEPDQRRRAVRELEILDQLSGLLLIGAGYSAPGLREICDRMRQLSHITEDRNLLVGSMWRLSIYYCTIVDTDPALELGYDLLASGQREGDPLLELTGHLALGVPNILRGELHTAKRHLDAALDMCRNGYDDALRGVMLETPGVWARSFSGWNTWLLGDTALAANLGHEAIAIGERSGHDSYAATIAFCIASWVAAMDHDAPRTRDLCADGIARAIAGGFEVQLFMKVVEGWAIATLGDPETGTSEILDASETLRIAGTSMLRPFHFAMLADVALLQGAYEDTLAYTDQGLSIVEQTDERWSEPELRRLRGIALSREPTPDLVAARRELTAAVSIADRHHSHVFAARARHDLAELGHRRPIGPARHDQP